MNYIHILSKNFNMQKFSKLIPKTGKHDRTIRLEIDIEKVLRYIPGSLADFC